MAKTQELLKEILKLNASGQLIVTFKACDEEFSLNPNHKDIDDCIAKDSFPVYFTEGVNQGSTATKKLADLMAYGLSVEWVDECIHSKYIKEQFDRILKESSGSIDYNEDTETLVLEFNYEYNGNNVHFLRFKGSNLMVNLKTLGIVEDYEVTKNGCTYDDSGILPLIALNATTVASSEFITIKKVSRKNYCDFIDAAINASDMKTSISLAKQSIRCMDFNQSSVVTDVPEYCGNDVDTYFERQRDVDAGLYDEVRPTRIERILKSMNSYSMDIRAALYHAMLNEGFILSNDFVLDKVCNIQHPNNINFENFTSIMSKQVSNYVLYYTTLALAPQNLSMVKFESIPTEEDLESIDEMLWEAESGSYIWESDKSENILDTYQDVKSFI